LAVGWCLEPSGKCLPAAADPHKQFLGDSNKKKIQSGDRKQPLYQQSRQRWRPGM